MLLAAYAAADAEVFPVDAHIIALEPSSKALATAITIPLSLKEPVGFNPSYLKYNSIPPSFSPIFSAFIKGVFPSFKLISGVLSVIGK